MADLRKLKDRAAELAAKGKLDKAAEVLREALAADLRDVAARQQLAEVLRRSGRTAEAIETYRAVADRFARDGLLIKAIAISKTILELEPAHVATQDALAELYAKRAAADGRAPAARAARPARAGATGDDERAVAIPLGMGATSTATPTPTPTATSTSTATSTATATSTPTATPTATSTSAPTSLREPLGGAVPTAYEQILSAADAAAGVGLDEELVLELDLVDELPADDEPLPGGAAPGAPAGLALPRVPIFSDLSREAFVALTGAVALRRAEPGERVVEEGDTGTSFFVVASGKLLVSRRDEHGGTVALARLRERDFFGEMALLSGAPRAASVVAEEPCELLELGAAALLAVAGAHPQLAGSLRRFYRQRLLANAMAVSPLFRPFGKGDRKLVMERFRAREVKDGEVIVREGEPSDGLYVVLDGVAEVAKRKDAGEVVVSHLRSGDLFGEMSCLRKAPASATVRMRRGGTLLRLPRAEFDALAMGYPQILELVSELTAEREESLDAILSGHAQWTDEGLVLF